MHGCGIRSSLSYEACFIKFGTGGVGETRHLWMASSGKTIYTGQQESVAVCASNDIGRLAEVPAENMLTATNMADAVIEAAGRIYSAGVMPSRAMDALNLANVVLSNPDRSLQKSEERADDHVQLQSEYDKTPPRVYVDSDITAVTEYLKGTPGESYVGIPEGVLAQDVIDMIRESGNLAIRGRGKNARVVYVENKPKRRRSAAGAYKPRPAMDRLYALARGTCFCDLFDSVADAAKESIKSDLNGVMHFLKFDEGREDFRYATEYHKNDRKLEKAVAWLDRAARCRLWKGRTKITPFYMRYPHSILSNFAKDCFSDEVVLRSALKLPASFRLIDTRGANFRARFGFLLVLLHEYLMVTKFDTMFYSMAPFDPIKSGTWSLSREMPLLIARELRDFYRRKDKSLSVGAVGKLLSTSGSPLREDALYAVSCFIPLKDPGYGAPVVDAIGAFMERCQKEKRERKG